MFTTAELGTVAENYSDAVIDDGSIVYEWRSLLVKYSTLPGIRGLHDFVFVRNLGSDVKLRVRPLCYTGAIQLMISACCNKSLLLHSHLLSCVIFLF